MSALASHGLPAFILVMGVSGAGKSTVAAALAGRIGGALVEGDSLHPAANIAAMSAGQPLTDAMRQPWLEAICLHAADLHRTTGAPVVIACSALKRRYRDLLRDRLPGLGLVHLDGTAEMIQSRLALRTDHFMPPSLLSTQIADLEPPGEDEGAITVDVAAPPADLLAAILARLRTTASAAADTGRNFA